MPEESGRAPPFLQPPLGLPGAVRRSPSGGTYEIVRSLDSIIEEFGPGLARAAAAYERNLALRQELLQEIHLALFRSLPQLKDAAKLRSFIFRIAHNC
jgi:hypothetical protein